MTLEEVMKELENFGTEQTRKTFCNHGCDGDQFGVKVGDLKKVLIQIKGDQSLAMKLWETNNSDAMYLAALVADGSQMTRTQLDRWAKSAWWGMLYERIRDRGRCVCETVAQRSQGDGKTNRNDQSRHGCDKLQSTGRDRNDTKN